MNAQMAWIFLLVAGMLEIAWAIGLPATKGFTKVGPSLYVFVLMAASFLCLSQSTKILPIGTAYAIWTGIGAAGTALIGIFFLGEPAHFVRLFCIFLIISGTLGLKLFP